MYAPTYLPEADRKRLAEINQMALGGKTTEELQEIEKDRLEIMGKTKPMQDCTYEELQELRRQLYEQFQKHSAIGSQQVNQLVQFIQMVELREYTLLQQKAKDEEGKVVNETAKPKGPSRVSTKQSSYSWTVASDDDD